LWNFLLRGKGNRRRRRSRRRRGNGKNLSSGISLAGFGFQKEKSLRSMNFHNSPFATFRLLCFGFRLPVLGVFMSVSCTYATEDVLCAYCDVSVYVRLCARACKSLSRFVIPTFFSLEKKKKKKK
jgi:hypothetical protein